jgi:hypothetical protein
VACGLLKRKAMIFAPPLEKRNAPAMPKTYRREHGHVWSIDLSKKLRAAAAFRQLFLALQSLVLEYDSDEQICHSVAVGTGIGAMENDSHALTASL